MEILILIAYCYFGDKANYYLKYHVLNRRAEIYSDTNNYILSRIIWATVLGWATIPLAIIHSLLFKKSD